MKNVISNYITTLYRETISSDFARKVSGTFLTRILLIGIGMITSIIVARILGPEGRGFYAVAAAVGAIGVQFANLGLQSSGTYYVAKDHKLLSPLVGNALAVSFALGGGGALAAWIIFSLVPHWAPLNGALLVFALLWVPFGLAYMLLQNLLLGIHEVHGYNVIELVTQIIGVALLGCLILVKHVSVETMFAAGLVALVIGFTWAFFKIKSHLERSPIPSYSLFKENIRYGIKAYLATFFAYLVLRVDLLLVKYMLGAEQTGYYSIAVTMADMVFMLPSVISMLLFPKLSSMSVDHDKWKFAKKITLRTASVMLILSVTAVLLAKPLVKLLFGETFAPAVPAFIWLVPGILFLGIQVVAVQFLNSIGFPKVVVTIWGLSVLVNILLNLWAIPAFGIIGASAVSSFSYLAVFILIMMVIRRINLKSEISYSAGRDIHD